MTKKPKEESKPNQTLGGEKDPYKVLTLGHDDSNKSEILNSLFTHFNENFIETIGVNIVSTYFEIEGNQVKFRFIDNAGESKLRHILVSYYRGANGFAFIFDLSKKYTFDLIANWMKNMVIDGKLPLDSVLIGNNQGSEKSVTKEEIDQLAAMYNIRYFEISPENNYKSGYEAFKSLATDIYHHMNDQQQDKSSKSKKSFLSFFKKKE